MLLQYYLYQCFLDLSDFFLIFCIIDKFKCSFLDCWLILTFGSILLVFKNYYQNTNFPDFYKLVSLFVLFWFLLQNCQLHHTENELLWPDTMIITMMSMMRMLLMSMMMMSLMPMMMMLIRWLSVWCRWLWGKGGGNRKLVLRTVWAIWSFISPFKFCK